jgi:peptide chain release factor subunit 3
MSKLNASAFEFVPGKRLGPGSAQQQPQGPPQPAFVRPEEPEAPPAPAPTINLNIGGAKPAPAAPPLAAHNPVPAHARSATPPLSAKPQPQQPKATGPSSSSSTPSRTPGNASPAPASAPSSKTFTMGRAKTDTAAIAHEVATVADQEVLEDLFGDSASPILPALTMIRSGTRAADE